LTQILQRLRATIVQLRGFRGTTRSSFAIDLFGDGLMIGTSLTIALHLGVMLASARV